MWVDLLPIRKDQNLKGFVTEINVVIVSTPL